MCRQSPFLCYTTSMKKILQFLLLALIIVIIALGLAGYYLYTLTLPVDPNATLQTKFVIPKGQAIAVIANRLHEQNLIKHPLVFRLAVKKEQLENKMQAGSFDLSASMDVWQIAHKLTQGTSDLWLTIPEGWRREEIASSIAKLDLPEYDQNEFLDLTTGLEGQLFPDSYLIPRMITTQALVNLLHNTFNKKIASLEAEILEASTNQLIIDAKLEPANDFLPLLTLASLIEREARGLEEMQMVAGILYNRLAIGMALQVDASLQYVKGFNQTKNDWWSPPLAVDKSLASPFNTYANAGLPPRPICNPGLDAIKATLTPTKNNYLFYLHDRQGRIHYGKDLNEHNANVNKYLR